MPSATRELLTGPFGRLVAARTISTIGTGLGPVALAFGILDLPHGSATLLSVVQGAYLLPLVLFGSPREEDALHAFNRHRDKIHGAARELLETLGDTPVILHSGYFRFRE